MTDLMTGKGTRDDYIALVAQHYFIYEALEAAAERMADDPVAAPFISPQLTRLPALEADLEFLIGADWRGAHPAAADHAALRRPHQRGRSDAGQAASSRTTTRATSATCRAGRSSARSCSASSASRPTASASTSSTRSPSPKEFKDTYREQLDAVDWDDEERERVIDEVVLAYRFNTELFVDLSAAKAAA